MDTQHLPVLVEETLALLDPRRGGREGIIVDATLGLGGHAEAILQASEQVQLVGIDRDPQALELAARRLAPFGERARFVNANFHHLEQALAGIGIHGGIAGVLADLGVSSMQLDTPERGFSFRFDAPLDMRMGSDGRTAADLVSDLDEQELMRIIREYGEESFARPIARAIVKARAEAPIESTTRLAEIIRTVKKPRFGEIDPATLTFQALRIATNEELTGLERFIDDAVSVLESGARMAVISFHSLEDRIVKRAFRRLKGECTCPPGMPVCGCGAKAVIDVLTNRPVTASEEEIARNPRSRSAKLRIAEKL